MEFLLSADFPGRAELALQVDSLEVVRVCECGCGTIDVAVGRPVAKADCRGPIPVEAHGAGVEVLLFVREGLISSLEVVDHGDARPIPYPQPPDLKLWIPPSKPSASASS